MARFFIDRPIFAWVIAIIIMLGGALSIQRLPIEQYPDIAPTTIMVNATYPGASARTVEDSVTKVIEQSLTGIDNVLYMSGSSSSQGSANIQLTFDTGTNPDTAQVQVQNKVQQAVRQLPAAVQAQGITVTKTTSGFLTVIGMYSEDGSMSPIDIADYVGTSLIDPLSRVDGVGQVQAFGAQYAMRLWLDPYKLNQFKLTPADVRNAVTEQNTQVSAGQLGGLPAVDGQQLNATITAQSKLQTVAQFRDIVLRVNADGSAVRLGDVARIELGAENYDSSARMGSRPASGMGISLASGANALKTADAVKAKIEELAQFFPSGLKYMISYDTTTFVRISINEVVKTLIEAIILVVLIMYLFLQNWRATLIPAIAVPVVLLGTFGVLAICGYTINTLTMFATVLAIGLLVDDAIVVVENVERIMHEEGLDPRAATRKSMDQITGALLGIALVLSAVFVPMAFFGGSTGVIYRQFSITIVSAMLLSVIVALILTPALCATLLKPVDAAHDKPHGGPLGWFNRKLTAITDRYAGTVGAILGRPGRTMLIYLLLGGGMALLLWRLPTAFLPEQDQGALMAQMQLAPGATQQRTSDAQRQLESLLDKEGRYVDVVMSMTGFSFGGSGQSAGMSFIRLKDWGERDANGSAASIALRTTRAASAIRDASVFVLVPSAIRGLGTSGGIDLQLKDIGGLGHDALVAARDQLLALAAKDPDLRNTRAQGLNDQPEFHINVDQARASAMGLDIGDVNDTISSAIGGSYINDFINKSRVKKVYMQADAPYRMLPSDLDKWYVRNGSGDMVPLSAVSSASWGVGPPSLSRYNGTSAIEITGEPAVGKSTGAAMNAIAQLIKQLPTGIGYEWSGISYQERLSGSQAPALYAVSILFVFLCLAALYESWTVPFSVIMVVPLGVIGALLAATLRDLSNDVYFQVGLLTTIGLAAKNAILIVEFAKSLHDSGEELIAATLQAVRIRLRPILMTSCAFMLGVLPLALSTGAGKEARIDIGTGVLGGMIAATLLGIFFVPLFFVLVQRMFGRRRTGAEPA